MNTEEIRKFLLDLELIKLDWPEYKLKDGFDICDLFDAARQFYGKAQRDTLKIAAQVVNEMS